MFNLFHATAHYICCMYTESAPEHAFPCQGLSPSVPTIFYRSIYIYIYIYIYTHTHKSCIKMLDKSCTYKRGGMDREEVKWF